MAKTPSKHASSADDGRAKTARAAASDFTSRYPPRPPAAPPEMVDPGWLLRALGLTIAAGLVLSYLTICLLLYQGAWQFILHPSPAVALTPAARNVAFEAVKFDAADSGQPRLSAWWIAGGQPRTILYLHDGEGSLAQSVEVLAALHRTGANLFAIDYRGFGTSSGPHPNEARMREDAEAAFVYLRDTRHVQAASIVPYGIGLGASLALDLAAAHPEIKAVVVDKPVLDATARVSAGRGSRLVPVRLLVRDRFEIAAPLARVTTPKLLIAGGAALVAARSDPALQAAFHAARDPKFTLDLPANAAEDVFVEGVRRFLDQYP